MFTILLKVKPPCVLVNYQLIHPLNRHQVATMSHDLFWVLRNRSTQIPVLMKGKTEISKINRQNR